MASHHVIDGWVSHRILRTAVLHKLLNHVNERKERETRAAAAAAKGSSENLQDFIEI